VYTFSTHRKRSIYYFVELFMSLINLRSRLVFFFAIFSKMILFSIIKVHLMFGSAGRVRYVCVCVCACACVCVQNLQNLKFCTCIYPCVCTHMYTCVCTCIQCLCTWERDTREKHREQPLISVCNKFFPKWFAINVFMILSCSHENRVAKNHRMPFLYR